MRCSLSKNFLRNASCRSGVRQIRLPFHKNPMLASYLYSAYPTGILGTKAHLINAIFNYNIQLYFRDKEPLDCGHLLQMFPHMGLRNYAELGLFNLSQIYYKNDEKITERDLTFGIIEFLESKSYVYAHLDYYYIASSHAYLQRHFRHEILIVGFVHDFFLCYLYTKFGRLEMVKVPVAMLVSAFLSLHGVDSSPEYCRSRLLMGVSCEHAVNQELNLVDFSLQLSDYIKSENRSINRISNPTVRKRVNEKKLTAVDYFGFKIYEKVLLKMKEALNGSVVNIDLRMTRLIWEHKRIMHSRLQLLPDIYSLNMQVEWDRVTHLAHQFHLLASHAQLFSSKITFEKFESLMLEMMAIEKPILEQIALQLPSGHS